MLDSLHEPPWRMSFAGEPPNEWSTKQNQALAIYKLDVISLPRMFWTWAVEQTRPQDHWDINDQVVDIDPDMRASLLEAWSSIKIRMEKAADVIYGTHPIRTFPSPMTATLKILCAAVVPRPPT